MPVLRVIHEHNAAWQPRTDDRPTYNDAVAVVDFAPIIVLNVDCRRVFLV